eukprot:PhM_4_TR16096/c0_g1_i1/m.90063/K15920/XYL4; beta-D-xylosidase 4
MSRVSAVLLFISLVGLVLGAAGESATTPVVPAYNQPIMLWNCSADADDPKQLFNVSMHGRHLVGHRDQQCLTIQGDSHRIRTVIWQDVCPDVATQGPTGATQWVLAKSAADGNVTFHSTINKRCLGTFEGRLGDIVSVQHCASPYSQWVLRPGKASPHDTASLQLKGTNLCAHLDSPFPNPCVRPDDRFHDAAFCNTSLTVDARVNDLVPRLTTYDKIGLLGHLANAAMSVRLPPYSWRQNAPHGIYGGYHMPVSNATSYPQVSLTGATFDADIFARVGRAIGRAARVLSNLNNAGLTFWAPNVNIYRDPRWGRGQETPGEDPYLTSVYAANFVYNFQNGKEDPTRLQASSCCKHFAAYSLENWGGQNRHTFDAIVSPQDLADTYTPSFEACAHQDGGAASGVMCSYNSVNGKPSCADPYLLTTLARDTWGFQGYVVSDCEAVNDVLEQHHYTNTTDATCAATLKAGMDLDCGTFLQTHTAQALADGAVQMSDVDAALRHMFAVQFRLGIFDPVEDQPYKRLPADIINSDENAALALEVAQKGIVLMQNKKNGLPYQPNAVRTVAIIGPNADAGVVMQGDYAGPAPYLTTPRAALEARLGQGNVRYARGSDVTGTNTSGFAEACSAASGRDVDAVIFVIGRDQSMATEGIDLTDISVPEIQRALIGNVTACAPTTAHITVLVMAGGSMDVSSVEADALLWVGYPGQLGGPAIVSLLFGDVAPSGRLPFTIYPSKYVDEVSMFDMGMRPNATNGNPGRSYRFYTGEPVYPFGFGLGYGDFVVSRASPSAVVVRNATLPSSSPSSLFVSKKRDKPVATVSYTVAVRNLSAPLQSTDFTALCFISGPNAGKGGRPLRTLIGFERLSSIASGESRSVSFDVKPIDVTVVGADGTRSVEPGVWTVEVEGVTVEVTVY